MHRIDWRKGVDVGSREDGLVVVAFEAVSGVGGAGHTVTAAVAADIARSTILEDGAVATWIVHEPAIADAEEVTDGAVWFGSVDAGVIRGQETQKRGTAAAAVDDGVGVEGVGDDGGAGGAEESAVAVAAAAATFDGGVGVGGGGVIDETGGVVENAVAVAAVVVTQCTILGREIVPARVVHKAAVVADADVVVVAADVVVVGVAGDVAVVARWLAFGAIVVVVVVIAGSFKFTWLWLRHWVRIAVTYTCGVDFFLCSAAIRFGFSGFGCFGWSGRCGGD